MYSEVYSSNFLLHAVFKLDFKTINQLPTTTFFLENKQA